MPPPGGCLRPPPHGPPSARYLSVSINSYVELAVQILSAAIVYHLLCWMIALAVWYFDWNYFYFKAFTLFGYIFAVVHFLWLSARIWLIGNAWTAEFITCIYYFCIYMWKLHVDCDINYGCSKKYHVIWTYIDIYAKTAKTCSFYCAMQLLQVL